LLEPRRQAAMRGRQRRGLEYEVIMPRFEDLTRRERPPSPREEHPRATTPDPLSSPSPLPSPLTGSEVQNTLAGGAPSGEKGNGSNHSGQEALPMETNHPSVNTPPLTPSKAPHWASEEGGETVNPETRGTPRVEHNNPPASAPPVPTTANSPPTGTPPPPQRGQRTRQPPAYLKDFVCDRITNGRQKSLTGHRTEKLPAKIGRYEPHVNIKFGEGGVGGKTTTPGAHSSALTRRTRCPAFSYADAVPGRRILSTNIQAKNVEYESKYQVLR